MNHVIFWTRVCFCFQTEHCAPFSCYNPIAKRIAEGLKNFPVRPSFFARMASEVLKTLPVRESSFVRLQKG